MDVKCAMIKLKPNCKEKVKQWAKTMNDRKPEAIETIVNEGITVESVFIKTINNEDYLIYYIRAKDFKKSQEVTAKSLMEIDAIHKQFKQECWESVNEAKLLLDLTDK